MRPGPTLLLFIILLLTTLPFGVARGQSFDCAAARLQAEKTICSGRWLSELDKRLDKAYKRLRSSLPAGRSRILLGRSQRRWIRARNQCRLNRRCLRAQYSDRLAEVEGRLGQRARILALEHPGPGFECGDARRAAGITICRWRHLANLDRRMDGLLRDALRKSRSNDGRRTLRLNQAQWIKVRNGCRFDRACLRRSYNNRIDYLVDVIADLVTRPDISPSFNCRQASLKAEKAICRSKRLAMLDVENDGLYKRALKDAPTSIMGKDIRESERAWLIERNGCGADRECLVNSYFGRIIYFENIFYYFHATEKSTFKGPGFDCGSVQKRAERMICASKHLSRLDRQMAGTYNALLEEIPSGARTTLLNEQNDWLVVRNKCGAGGKCLRMRYHRRISALEAQLDDLQNQNWKRRVKVSPSFNCKYARLPVETAICDNSVLAQLDREMASAYFTLRDRTSNSTRLSRLKAQQRAWLGQRNNCGYRVNCLRDQYERRLYQLERYQF